MGAGPSRILVDVATASREVTSRLLLLAADGSGARPSGHEFGGQPGIARGVARPTGSERQPATVYLLNQFDASVPLHLDVRATLQQQLGDRLLPFVLRRSSAVSEALAEGMTVIDYAPDSAAAEDYRIWPVGCAASRPLAGHVGTRWSER